MKLITINMIFRDFDIEGSTWTEACYFDYLGNSNILVEHISTRFYTKIMLFMHPYTDNYDQI